MSLRMRALLTLGLAPLTLYGCASTTSYTPVNYCSAPVSASMARIVLRRRQDFVGRGTPIRVFDDNQPIGEVGPGGRLCWDRYPGTALIMGGSVSNTGLMTDHLLLHVKPDTVYNVSVSMSGKWRLTKDR